MPANVITNVQFRSSKWKIYLTDVENLCQQAASAVWQIAFESDKIYEVTIALADDIMVQELNLKYRQKNKPTNVLSFSSGLDKNPFCDDIPTLGDIVLAFETIQAEAPENMSDHLCHLVVHGCLHLLGYNHEDNSGACKMEAMEIKILKVLGIKNPYDQDFGLIVNQNSKSKNWC